jgi:formylglycine-generating enzyme required for sulfatase activity/serine/threonine protein kinase
MIVESMALTPGTVVERFTIDRVIALNASSITYRATDTLSGSPFVLREHVPAARAVRGEDGSFVAPDEQAAGDLSTGVARFLADSAGAATLHHPGIAAISRWFKANGTAYLVMPWLPGTSLAAMLHDGRILSAREALALALPVLDALEYLHAQEIVHQELSPGYIHVLEVGGAVLLGCGACAARDGEGGIASASHKGEAYAAIEQFLPGRQTGPWTDIYGLAATLYHGISGTAPPTARQRWAAVQAHEPDPLTPIDVTADDSQARREIVTLIARGMALEPSARPQSVREWRARITRLPTARDDQESESGGHDAAEGRRWLPIISIGVFLLGITAIGIYLLANRPHETGLHTDSSVQSAPGGDRTSAEETERWRQALEVNAVVGYRDFMADFPQSSHKPQAQEHIDQLEDKAWLQVVAEDTRAAHEAHLEMFPQGRHVTAARARIEEFDQEEARLARERDARARQDDSAWDSARTAGSLAALDGYISAWPGGTHIAEARDLRQKLQYQGNDAASFAVAAREHTIEAYRTYIRAFPDGRNVPAAQAAIESLTLRTGKTFQDCSECPLMVVVPAGAFWQGSADASPLAISIEKPRRRVVIAQPFAVSTHEITMAQWDACVADSACETRPADNGWGRGTRPVMMVSWNDAMQYAGWISTKTGQNYTLPSESQWEYFARAGEEGDWLGGDAAGICQYGNIAGNETSFDWRHKDCSDGSAVATMPTGSYRPNAFGLYDVIGNVAEWTLDCMNLSYLDAPADGSAWSRGMCSSRMTRGGSWFTGTKESRLSARFNLRNGDRNDFTGFRLVRQVEKQ